jgi:Uncharacterized protein conserved in bacteria (DUF2252)
MAGPCKVFSDLGPNRLGPVSSPRQPAFVAVALVWAACASAPPPPPEPPAEVARPLDVARDAPELERNSALRARLRSGPHAYFRFLNRPFTSLVCARFADLALPRVTLHGDAHLEQYAVTDLGRGLTDFDDASAGPAVVDLVRFGTSLRLAAEERGWKDRADELWGRFWAGYELALRDPTAEAPEPELARRLKAGFETDRVALLARAEALIDALAEPRPMLDEETKKETIATLARNSGVPVSFFRVKRAGALRIGIGSAADEKYLFRMEGETDAAEDDILLEFKEVRDLSSIPCIHHDPGPTRIIVGQARIAYEPFLYPGAVHAGGLNFWVHAWPLNYAEVDVDDLRSPEELGEVVYDAGVQLGRGHPKRWSAEEAVRLRRDLAAGLPAKRVRAVTAELAAETRAAWERFRAASWP